MAHGRRAVMMGVWATLALMVAPMAAQAQVPSTDRIAIVGARVFPSPEDAVIEDATVLIEGDRIAAVGARASVAVPDGYRVIDAAGRSVTAGFWNSHIHLTRPVLLTAAAASDEDLQRELEGDFTRWGFTTVFDLASTTEAANAIKRRVADGEVAGPRLLSVGEPFYPPQATPIYARPLYEAFDLPSAEISSPEEAAERARVQIAAGDDGVKLFTGSIVGGADGVVIMQADAVRAVTDAARALGRPSFAHPTNRAGLEVAVENGVGVLAHAAPLMGPWEPATAQWIADHDVALIPTLALFEEAANPATPVAVAAQQAQALQAAGGVVLFGTDAGFTDVFDTSAEMRLMNAALGWRGLLASLTTAPAETFGEGEIRGRVAPGYAADLVILDGDPSADVAAMSDVRTVLRAGVVIYDRAEP